MHQPVKKSDTGTPQWQLRLDAVTTTLWQTAKLHGRLR